MAKSEWKVQSNYIAGEGTRYIAMRVLDTNEVVHSGNVEHYGEYSTDREEICRLVERLNRGEVSESEDYEDYWCERCCNFDRERVGVDAYAPCKFTCLPTFAETYAKHCRGFNVPAEQATVKREQISCEQCRHLDVIKGRCVYAVCRMTDLVFEAVQTPGKLNPETFYCAFAKEKENRGGKNQTSGKTGERVQWI